MVSVQAIVYIKSYSGINLLPNVEMDLPISGILNCSIENAVNIVSAAYSKFELDRETD